MIKAGVYLYKNMMVDGTMQGPGFAAVSEAAASALCGGGKARGATAEELAAAGVSLQADASTFSATRVEAVAAPWRAPTEE